VIDRVGRSDIPDPLEREQALEDLQQMIENDSHARHCDECRSSWDRLRRVLIAGVAAIHVLEIYQDKIDREESDS
jgi:hypothetical protein